MDCKNCKNSNECRFKLEGEQQAHCNFFILAEATQTGDPLGSTETPGYKPDYAYATLKDYEKIVGFTVNDAFRIGWNMARTTNKQLGIL